MSNEKHDEEKHARRKFCRSETALPTRQSLQRPRSTGDNADACCSIVGATIGVRRRQLQCWWFGKGALTWLTLMLVSCAADAPHRRPIRAGRCCFQGSKTKEYKRQSVTTGLSINLLAGISSHLVDVKRTAPRLPPVFPTTIMGF